MNLYHAAAGLLILAIVLALVGIHYAGQTIRGAKHVIGKAEADTWGDEDQHWKDVRRVLEPWTCVDCGRNAGHNAGCPSVRRHRAVREGGES